MRGSPVRTLQIAVAVAAIVPVSAGLAGILGGPAFVGAETGPDADSHFRYLSGLLLGIGLCYWATVPDIVNLRTPFRLLTAIVVIGGIGRLASVLAVGVPSPEMIAALIMELVVTPGLALWRERLDARRGQSSSSGSAQAPRRGIAP
jgi:hypothetical protein